MLVKFLLESQWLEARKQDVTSSEVAAMFGLDPDKSRLRLWYEKAGLVESDFAENAFTKWGRRLQTSVGLGICEDEGWQGFDLTGYYARDPARRLGASFDIRAVCPKRGNGPLEVKVAESFSEELGWFPDQAPIKYEFQLATQMHVLRLDDPVSWGAIGTLGRRQKTRLYQRKYDPELGAMIDEEVESFWASIEAKEPPPPDYTVDGPLIERLRGRLLPGDVVNLTGNNRAHDLIHTYVEKVEKMRDIMGQIKPLDDEATAIQAEIYDLMGRHEKAIIGPYQVGARVQKVAERFNPGYEFRRFDVTQRKKGK